MTATSPVAFPRDSTGESAPPSGIAVRPLRIGLIGFGAVGRGFADLLARESANLALARGIRPRLATVLVRDARRERGLPRALPLTADPASFLATDCDVVVEASGAVQTIEPVVRAVLERGTPVVTANKALIAERGAVLARIARGAGTELRFEASVAAGIPLFQLLERSLQSTRIRRIAAILNGTTNFVLTRLAQRQGGPVSIDEALDEARKLGFAESDPTEDTTGVDAARKLAILATAVFPSPVSVGDVETTGIGDVRAADCARAAVFGYRVKPLAVAEPGETPRAWVAPALVDAGHPLASVENESNGIHLAGDTVAEIFVAGPGAGARPTAAALLDDVLLAFESERPTRPVRRGLPSDAAPALSARGRAELPWFLSISITEGAIEPSDVIEYVAATGLPFTEIRRLPEPGGILTIAGITAPATPARVESVRLLLRKVAAIQDVRALRVLETEARR